MKNSQRSIVKIIKEICSENKILYKTFSYDWIFYLSKNGKTTHIFGYQFENNSATSQLICSDKCATSDVLRFNNIPAVNHIFFMSPTNIKYIGTHGNWKKLLGLLSKHGKLVCKPNEGSGGEGVHLVSNQFELENAAYKIFRHSRSMAVCPFYKIESEFRVIVFNNSIKLLYSKNIPYIMGDGKATIRQLIIKYTQEHTDYIYDFNIPEDDNLIVLNNSERYYLNWKHNLGQGAKPIIVDDKNIVENLSDLALRASSAVNIKFASVDIIKTNDIFLVLEINSGIMMENFSQTSSANYQIAKGIYKEAIESMLR